MEILKVAILADRAGVTSLRQLIALASVWQKPGIDVFKLSNLTGAATTTVHGFLKRMEELGLIRRESQGVPVGGGKERHLFYLAERGAALFDAREFLGK